MVCRTTSIGSAITSHARLTSGLEDQQTLSQFHELLREGRAAAAPTRAAQTALIDVCRGDVLRDRDLTDARRNSLLARLDSAYTQRMDGRTYYAARRMMSRANRASVAWAAYREGLARDLGCSVTYATDRLNQHITQASSDRSLRAPREWQEQFAANPENGHLPLDRATAYAISQMENDRQAAREAAATRSTVTRHPVQSEAVRELGYNPTTGLLEVVMNSNPDRVYRYRVPAQVYERLISGSIGSYFARYIRGNDEYRYDSAQDAEYASVQTQCPTCGQFAGPGHACPTRDSAAERHETQRRAREAARPTRTATSSGTPTETPSATEPTLVNRLDRRYFGASGSFRTASLSEVRWTTRNWPSGVNLAVESTLRAVAGPDGQPVDVDPARTVTGRVHVTYNGRGRGYTVAPVTEPGPAGTSNLRCTCPDYQSNYDCVHVRQVVQDVANRINQPALRDQHTIGEAVAAAYAELAEDRAESIAAQSNARERWTPVNSYTDDMRAFKADYRAAKARVAAGEAAIPYMTENATDGLGARDGGRGFGVEIEFDISDHSALAAIGRDLHAAGLTRSAHQGYYHAAASRGYTDQHRGGWSFEADCTVAGEIVSPIMYDEPETWENIAKVCEIVKRHGGRATVNTGSHVHVSTHNYDHTVENYNRLMSTFAENEDLIYRLSSDPARGSHRGPSWCAPNRNVSNGYRSLRDARSSNSGHHLGMNLGAVNGSSGDNVEFRTWDQTLDPSVIQMQIKTSLAITEAAFRDTDHTPATAQPLGTARAHNRATYGASRRLTGEAWEQDTAGFRRFADRLFRRPEDKAQLTALFAVTKWQRTRR